MGGFSNIDKIRSDVNKIQKSELLRNLKPCKLKTKSSLTVRKASSSTAVQSATVVQQLIAAKDTAVIELTNTPVKTDQAEAEKVSDGAFEVLDRLREERKKMKDKFAEI